MAGPPSSAPGAGWLALGLDFVLRAEGGRRTPLDLSRSPSYRPNWGLPWMTGTEQTAAWVLCGAPVSFAPGGRGRLVIAPFVPEVIGPWRRVRAGDELRAFEGPKVVGTGRVSWVEQVESPSPVGPALELLRGWVREAG